jgi:hypothetical protein
MCQNNVNKCGAKDITKFDHIIFSFWLVDR